MKTWNRAFSVLLSLVCHLILALFFLFYSHPFFKPKKQKLLIENSIQVDQIGLPDLPKEWQNLEAKTQTAQEKAPAKSPISKKSQKPKKEKNLVKKTQAKKRKKPKPIKTQTKASTKKPKTEKKPEDKQGPANTTKQESSKTATVPKKTQAESSDNSPQKGNQLSQGGNKGDVLNPHQKSLLSYYAQRIVSQTKSYWNLPNYLMKEKRVTLVEIKISSSGQLSYKQIVVSSGSELYDGLVLKAIEQAAPYPQAPESIQKFIQSGIVLSFPNH